MKRILALILISLFIPAVASAGKTLPFNHLSVEFIEKYNSGFDDSSTKVDEWDWLALKDNSYSMEIITGVEIFVVLDGDNGNIREMHVTVPVSQGATELSKESYVISVH